MNEKQRKTINHTYEIPVVEIIEQFKNMEIKSWYFGDISKQWGKDAYPAEFTIKFSDDKFIEYLYRRYHLKGTYKFLGMNEEKNMMLIFTEECSPEKMVRENIE